MIWEEGAPELQKNMEKKGGRKKPGRQQKKTRDYE